MRKVIVTLRDAPNVSVEVPEEFPRKRRAKKAAKKDAKKEAVRKIDRSVFGAIRLFPGVPKAISAGELEYIRLHRPDLSKRLDARPYVESKRVDYRGAAESAIEDLAAAEGIGHLEFSGKVRRLTEREKIQKPDPKKSSETRIAPEKDGGKTTGRKPK